MEPYLTGKPELMKQMNVTLLYRALLKSGSATRAEITDRTRVSATTIRSLLEELLTLGEITELRLDASSGGRRAQRYALNPARNLILSFYTENETLFYEIAGLTGEVCFSGSAVFNGGDALRSLTEFVAACRTKWDLCAVGMGVAGIIDAPHSDPDAARWGEEDLSPALSQACGLPVLSENDLNATALGFAMQYAASHPDCDLKSLNMAYIHFNSGCSGAGVIADGKVVRGAKRFAGEVGFLPMEPGRTLDMILAQGSPAECADAVARAVTAVNCITNPALVVVGGEQFQTSRIERDAVKAAMRAYGPTFAQPELLFCTDCKHDYLKGLRYLTAQTVIPLLPLRGNQFWGINL